MNLHLGPSADWHIATFSSAFSLSLRALSEIFLAQQTVSDICNMHILLVAATSHEIQPTAEFLAEKKLDAPKLKIDVLVTGVGMVSTTYFLTQYLSNSRPSLIIQAGIAGSFYQNKNNNVVAIEKDLIADLGVIEKDTFRNIFELNLAGRNDFPFKEGSLVNPYKKLLSESGLQRVNAVSVNEITTNKNRIELYQQRYQPFVESMEGAAFHYVCLLEKIPFLQLRAVSNLIGERDKSRWTIKESIAALNETLVSLINKISTQDETYFGV